MGIQSNLPYLAADAYMSGPWILDFGDIPADVSLKDAVFEATVGCGIYGAILYYKPVHVA